MNLNILSTAAVILLCNLSVMSNAALAQNGTIAQAQPSARQVLEACSQNRAETLPNPYIDVSPSHWAYKALLTLHYCGAYRQATPPSLIEKLTR
jgi:hypothetical protein